MSGNLSKHGYNKVRKKYIFIFAYFIMKIKQKENSIILENNNEYIGNIKYAINNNLLLLSNVFISPKYRKKDYSKYLFEELYNLCAKETILRIELLAEEYFSHYNKLVKYYEKFGFNIDKNKSIKQIWKDGELIRLIHMYKII
jgi:GNAT superfamily N-acetyltransferase